MKVIVIEDKPMIRRAIIETVQWEALDCEVVASAGDGLEGKRLIEQHKPDIIITDIRMPELDGLQVAAYVATTLKSCKVIVITGYEDFTYAKECVRLGVSDYILKPINNEEIETAIINAVTSLHHERHTQVMNTQLYTAAMRQFFNDLLSGQSAIDQAKHAPQSTWLQGHRLALLVARQQADQDIATDIEEVMKKKDQNIYELPFYDVYRIVLQQNFILIYIFKDNVTVQAMEMQLQHHMQKLKKLADGRRERSARLEMIVPIKGWEQLQAAYVSLEQKLSRQFFNIDALQVTEEAKLSIIHELVQFRIDLEAAHFSIVHDRITSYLVAISQYARGNISIAKSLVSELCITIVEFFYSKLHQSYGNNQSLHTLLSDIHNISNMTDAELYIRTLLDEHRQMLAEQSPTYSPLVKDVLQFIDQHYNQELTLSSLATQFHVSSGHLSRLLRKETGVNFVDIVSRTRINVAKQLLRDPAKRVQEVSELAGFKNYIYFYQVFKKSENVSPQQYRQSL